MPSGVYKRTNEMNLKRKLSGYKPPSRKGIPNSEEQKLKISLKLKGRKKNPESVKKSALSRTGQKRSQSFKDKLKAVMTGRTGDKANNWRGGITPLGNKMRKARLKEIGGSHTEYEWELLKAQYNWTCPCCNTFGIKLTKDHIIPVSKGGSDNIENIQPLCSSCNSRKHVKTIKY